MPCAATRVAPIEQLRAVGCLERLDGRLARARRESRPSRCAASGKRASTASCTSTWRAKTTSGSPDARKSAIHASAARELAARRQALQRAELREALGAQRRGDLRVELAQVQRLRAQPGDDVLLGEPVLALVVERDRHDDLALGRQLRQHLALQPPHEAAPAQVPVQALLRQLAAELARELRARAEVLAGGRCTRSCATSSSAWLSTGVPLSASRSPSVDDRVGQPPHGLRALGLRVLDVVRLVDDQRARPQPRRAPRGARRRSRS